jgi:hypothetical protein
MILFTWKNSIINLEGLRNTSYSSTNWLLTFHFQNGDKVDVIAREKDFEEIYEKIYKAVEKSA